jgi:hypothetical protein
MSENKFIDESSIHDYRTEIPNIIFELGLKSTELSLYLAYKRSAGDTGQCTKSSIRIAKEAGISDRIVKKIREKLAGINPVLKKPLIKFEERFSDCGDQETFCITIIDIWPENFERFYKNNRGGEKTTPPPEKTTPGVVKKRHQGGEKTTPKEQPTKKNPLKKVNNNYNKVVVVVSQEQKEQAKKCVDFFDKKSCEWLDPTWKINESVFIKLIHDHGYDYINAQIAYMVKQHSQAIKDEKNNKKECTPRIRKPLPTLRTCCSKNFADFHEIIVENKS